MLIPLFALSLQVHGALLLVGGGKITPEMMESFADLCGGKSREIVILPQTQSDPANGKWILEILLKAGFRNVFVFEGEKWTDQERKLLEERLLKAGGVWVPEGNQALFVKRFGLDWCHRVFPKLIERGVNWFGTSAGAMLPGDIMFSPDEPAPGLGLVDGIIDTHFRVKNREWRLRKAYFDSRVQLGIGLDEGEWIIIRDNLIEKKVGEPQVFLRESG